MNQNLPQSLYKRLSRRLFGRTKKRTIRYGLLSVNFLVLLLVTGFVLNSSKHSEAIKQTSFSSPQVEDSNPLDQLSSADIAVNVAKMANLYEQPAVVSNADSVNAQSAIVSSDETVVAKPQIVATAAKSKKDIKSYVTVNGDTVSSLASKFGVTSDSIRWSNGITGDVLAVGKTLTIPPVNGIVYTVKQGDTADTLAAKYHANKEQLLDFNDAEANGVKTGDVILIPDGTPPVTPRTVTSLPSQFIGGITAIYGNNGYAPGWCTWYVANRRAEMGRPVPNNLGNANTWYIIAQRSGLPTGTAPAAGAVAVNQSGNHVMVVEQVNGDGSFWISEMNAYGQVSMTDSRPAGGWNRIDWRLVPSVGNLKFIY